MNSGLCDHFCPALMNDGRFITDFRSRCYTHTQLMNQNGLVSSYDIKSFLQNNALKLQDLNRQFFENKNKSAQCSEYYQPDPNGHIEYWDQYKRKLGDKLSPKTPWL